MAQATFVFRIAVGACGALIIGATALARTSPPASTPPAQAPTASAAPQFPPTATITTPGYPAIGPADSTLRVLRKYVDLPELWRVNASAYPQSPYYKAFRAPLT